MAESAGWLGRARPSFRRDRRAHPLAGGEGARGDAQRKPGGGEHLRGRRAGHRGAAPGGMTAEMKSAAENLVEISGVEFSYGARKLLKGLSLKIPRRKVVALLGAGRY